MTPARGVEDVEPGIVNPGGPPLPPADASAGGHPREKKRGKFSSMTFSLIRSCQERSTGWARFVVTIASVGTVLDLVIIKILEVPSTFMLPPFALNS